MNASYMYVAHVIHRRGFLKRWMKSLELVTSSERPSKKKRTRYMYVRVHCMLYGMDMYIGGGGGGGLEKGPYTASTPL